MCANCTQLRDFMNSTASLRIPFSALRIADARCDAALIDRFGTELSAAIQAKGGPEIPPAEVALAVHYLNRYHPLPVEAYRDDEMED